MRQSSLSHANISSQSSLLYLSSGEHQTTKRIREQAIARLQTESLSNFCIHLNFQLHYVQTVFALFVAHFLLIDLLQISFNPPTHDPIRRWTITIGRNLSIQAFVVSSFCSFYGSVRHRLGLYVWHAWLLVASILLLLLPFVVFGISSTRKGNLVGGWMFRSERLKDYNVHLDKFFIDRFRLPELHNNIDALQTSLQCCGFNGPEDWLQLTYISEDHDEDRHTYSNSSGVNSNSNPNFNSYNLPFSCCSNQTDSECLPDLAGPGCRYRINLYNEQLINHIVRWMCMAYAISVLTLVSVLYLLKRYQILYEEERIKETKLVTSSETKLT